jgi:hypothetical protein
VTSTLQAQWTLPLSSEFLKATPFGVAADFQVHLIAIGALAFGSALAPEVGDASLHVRIVLKILPVHHHRLAAEVHAAGTIGGSGLRHKFGRIL